MFDVAFSELLIIAVVALIVIGPEKLPKVARTLGLLTGRMKRYVAAVKSDIERDLQVEELRKLQQDAQRSVSALESSVKHELWQTETAATALTSELASPVNEARKAVQ